MLQNCYILQSTPMVVPPSLNGGRLSLIQRDTFNIPEVNSVLYIWHLRVVYHTFYSMVCWLLEREVMECLIWAWWKSYPHMTIIALYPVWPDASLTTELSSVLQQRQNGCTMYMDALAEWFKTNSMGLQNNSIVGICKCGVWLKCSIL